MVRNFLVAAQFLTRLPVPRSLIATEGEIGQAAMFFPLVGVLVGGGGALLYAALIKVLPQTACVVILLAYLALVTNGFHEDGFADALDGFGGGWTRDDSLRIMRDSRIGTFGALGLVLLVLAKYNLLSILEWQQLWRCLIFAHAASRWTALPLCVWLPYARAQGQGKLVARRISLRALVIGSLTLAAVAMLFPWRDALMLVAATVAVTLLSGFYYRRRLNGITGDCLGATNQLAEVAIYFVAVALSR